MIVPMLRRALPLACLAGPLLAQLPDGYVDEEYLSGFAGPVGFVHDASGRMVVWERGGRAWVIQNGVKVSPPLLDIADEVGSWRDFGMLGLALDPDFLANGHLYAYYVVDRHHLLHHGTAQYDPDANEYFAATIGRVTRFTADPTTGFTTVIPGSRLVLLGETADSGVPILHQSHGTGALVFGADGTLLVSSGDGASYDTVDAGSLWGTYWEQALADGIIRPEENVGAFRSQMIGSLSGKILRIDPATGDGLPTNPFYDPDAPRSPRSRVWALGLRNPFRFTRRPGTGAEDPAAGDPGVLYVGDVGWSTWEELHVVAEAGMNLGWPIYEGLTKHASAYNDVVVENLDAPNPLYDGAGCDVPYFCFQDLLKQERESHDPKFRNPCDPSVEIPPSTPTFMHRRAAVEWRHFKDMANVPVFEDGKARRATLGDPDSPVLGDSFGGTCSVGGTWMSGLGFGEPYQGLYFHADHTSNWIRAFDFEPDETLHEVLEFGPAGTPTFLGEDPADGSLLYVQLAGHSIRRIRFTGDGNVAPKAVADLAPAFGPSPRTVRLDGSASFDPEGGDVRFLWEFEDGSTSSLPSPVVTLDNPGGQPAHEEALLTVTDSAGAAGHTHVHVHLDNTPPQVDVAGAVNGDTYPTDADTLLTLDAVATDLEHTAAELSYRWQLFLHHGSHVHPEPEVTTQQAQFLLTPTPCSGEFYAYRIDLEVSDPEGLAGERSLWLFPECDWSGSATVTSPTPGDVIDPHDTWTVEVQTTGAIDRVDLYVDGELAGTSFASPFQFPWTPTRAGEHVLAAVAQVDGEGAVTSPGVVIDVRAPLRVEAPVTRVRDDAEEMGLDGAVVRGGPVLNLGLATTTAVLTGLRAELDVPQGAKVVSAHLELTSHDSDRGLAQLTVAAEATDDAERIQPVTADLSARPRTAAQVTWTPEAWRYAGARGERQRSPDLKAVIQEVVDRPGWRAGSRVLLLVEGFGQRRARAFTHGGVDEPVLVVEVAP